MKKILKTGLVIILITILYTSCDSLATTDDVVMDRNQKPLVNLTMASVTVIEGQSTAITITTDTPDTKDLIFKLVQTGGNAESGVDYEFENYSALDYGEIGGRIVIPAHQTSGTLMVKGLLDYEVDNKSASFELRSIESMRGVVGEQNKISFDVEDFVDDNLNIILGWKTNDSDNYGDCDQDLDLYLVDENDIEISHSWFDCPEGITLNANLPDGVYYVDIDYWAPSDFSFPGTIDYKVKHMLTIGKVGSYSTTIENSFDDADVTTSVYLDWSGYGAFGGDGYHQHVAKIIKTGSSYVVEDSSGTILVSGKLESKISPRFLTEGGFTSLD